MTRAEGPRPGRAAGPAALMLAAALAGCARAPERPSLAAASPAPVAPVPAAASAGPPGALPVAERSWSFGGYEGLILETPHYRLHTTLERPAFRERLPVFMEVALSHYASAIVTLPPPPEALETYLFESRHQWEAKTRQMLAEQASQYLRLGRGGFTTRGVSVLYYIGRRDTLAIAAHEGWHQFSQKTFRNPLPIWLEEGIAAYMEGYLSRPDGTPRFRPWANLERYEALRQAQRQGRLVPLRELAARRPESLLQGGGEALLAYYAQVWALVHFLVEGEEGRYRPALERLLRESAAPRAGRGGNGSTRLGTDVLQSRFNRDLAALEQEYHRFVQAVTITGGREAVVRGESPLRRGP